MNNEWYFEIGDGQTYGPFPLEKLQKWAELGHLMPTHRVRHAAAADWVIAASVPGLENTLSVSPAPSAQAPPGEVPASFRASLGKLGRAISGRKSTVAESSSAPGAGKSGSPPDSNKAADIDRVPQLTDAIRICDEIIETAVERRASDIHLEPEQKIALVQLRVDGELETLTKYPKPVYAMIISRFKVLSRMDIAEKRSPQDGRFSYAMKEGRLTIDIRTACLPTTHGERMTLRLLAVETEQLTIHRLGLAKRDLELFADAMKHRQGLVLITGPTGSGKSTTLYAALRHLLAHRPGKIITVEDPVEFDIVGVAQVEVDNTERVQFETALRTILRSDPDVIMIGEMRDAASADIALKAALTGHLVLSSLHTNSALGAVTRLLNLGIPPYLVAATIRLCMAQRLIRCLCPYCRHGRILKEADAQLIGRPAAVGATIYEAGKCAKCNDRGYRGRIGIFEVVPFDNDFVRSVAEGRDEEELCRLQARKGIPSLKDDAVEKLLAGKISLPDLLAAVAI